MSYPLPKRQNVVHLDQSDESIDKQYPDIGAGIGVGVPSEHVVGSQAVGAGRDNQKKPYPVNPHPMQGPGDNPSIQPVMPKLQSFTPSPEQSAEGIDQERLLTDAEYQQSIVGQKLKEPKASMVMNEEEEDGQWVTIEGRPVFVGGTALQRRASRLLHNEYSVAEDKLSGMGYKPADPISHISNQTGGGKYYFQHPDEPDKILVATSTAQSKARDNTLTSLRWINQDQYNQVVSQNKLEEALYTTVPNGLQDQNQPDDTQQVQPDGQQQSKPEDDPLKQQVITLVGQIPPIDEWIKAQMSAGVDKELVMQCAIVKYKVPKESLSVDNVWATHDRSFEAMNEYFDMYDEERKEHPDFTIEQIWQIVSDHLKAKVKKHRGSTIFIDPSFDGEHNNDIRNIGEHWDMVDQMLKQVGFIEKQRIAGVSKYSHPMTDSMAEVKATDNSGLCHVILYDRIGQVLADLSSFTGLKDFLERWYVPEQQYTRSKNIKVKSKH
jgi:hypothetical protein